MKLLVGNQGLSELISYRFENGSMILFKYGKGSSGDVILKQFLSAYDEECHSVLISTHESEEEMLRSIQGLTTGQNVEMISMVPDIENNLEGTIKKDRFRNEGIMVTDLLEVSSNTGIRKRPDDLGPTMLSKLSDIAQKQVLPFRLVIDSISDLSSYTEENEVEKRLRILKMALREKGGYALVAAPFEWDGFWNVESTLFDGIIEITASDTTGSWKRELIISNRKGSVDPPERWDVSLTKDIPTAKSLD
jgi:KaiC/GvpD/RAD55 family RecA-like ATPase